MKVKLRNYIASRPSLKELLKKILPREDKIPEGNWEHQE